MYIIMTLRNLTSIAFVDIAIESESQIHGCVADRTAWGIEALLQILISHRARYIWRLYCRVV